MAEAKKNRDTAAEKAVKERLKRTHLKYIKILGSQQEEGYSAVYLLRMVGNDNYLFQINCTPAPGGVFELSGFIPVNDIDQMGDYKVYMPKDASADALRPTGKETKFTGYGK